MDRLVQIFGKESTYVEMQNAHLEPQQRINPLLAKMAEGTGLGLVATGDVHYLSHEDARAHEALLCIQSGDSLKNPQRWKFDTDHFYFKSPEEMALDFPGYDHALRRTLEVAERCNVSMELGGILLPKFPTPDERDSFDYLVELTERGLEKRYDKITDELNDRLKFELKTIREMGFADYFLIVWDFIAFAKKNGIQVGPGRGSAAGSPRRLLPRHHRHRPDQVRPALRAVPQPGRIRCPTWTSTSPSMGATASSTTSPRSTAATASRRSSPSRRWPRARRCAMRGACSRFRTASSTRSPSRSRKARARRSMPASSRGRS